MDYSTAKADAEKDGSEKAERTKKLIKRVIQVAGTVVIALIFTVALHQFMDWKHTQPQNEVASGNVSQMIPMATDLPPAQWPVATVIPYGVSGHINVPLGMHIVAPGTGFEIHVVYVNDQECVVNSITNPCPNKADVAYVYFKNTTDTTEYISYAYAYGKT